MFSIKYQVLKRRILAFPGGPGGFRELRGAGRNHFHLSWYLLVAVVTNYGLNKESAYFFVFFSGVRFS